MFDWAVNIIRPFFSTVVVSVNIDDRVCTVLIDRTRDGKLLESTQRNFRTFESDFPVEAGKFIRNYKRKYPFTYLCALVKSYNQGILDTNSPKAVIGFGIIPKENTIIYFEEGFSIYAKNTAIHDEKIRYITALGIDLLFSPFLLGYTHIKDELDDTMRLYVLQERSASTLFIADSKGVHFGGYFSIGSMETSSSDSSIFDSVGSNLKEELEESGYLEDIDEKDASKVFNEHYAMTVTNLITSCLQEFYSNDIYSSAFIEEVVILDTYGIPLATINYIASNTMLEIRIQEININKELRRLAKLELASLGELV